MNIEKRYHPTEVRSLGGRIVGTASPAYNGQPGTQYMLWEGAYERFAPGAFDDHLRTQPDVVALFNHNRDWVLGRTPGTLSLRADGNGLHYEISPPDTQVARDVLTSIGRGDLRGSSFAFIPDDVEWFDEGENEIRLIKKAKLYDVSVVTTPAYDGSSTSLRSAEERKAIEQERNDYRAKLETEKRFARLETLVGKHR